MAVGILKEVEADRAKLQNDLKEGSVAFDKCAEDNLGLFEVNSQNSRSLRAHRRIHQGRHRRPVHENRAHADREFRGRIPGARTGASGRRKRAARKADMVLPALERPLKQAVESVIAGSES